MQGHFDSAAIMIASVEEKGQVRVLRVKNAQASESHNRSPAVERRIFSLEQKFGSRALRIKLGLGLGIRVITLSDLAPSIRLKPVHSQTLTYSCTKHSVAFTPESKL
jgi:hypothetical protein